jgi:hypothetical protein
MMSDRFAATPEGRSTATDVAAVAWGGSWAVADVTRAIEDKVTSNPDGRRFGSRRILIVNVSVGGMTVTRVGRTAVSLAHPPSLHNSQGRSGYTRFSEEKRWERTVGHRLFQAEISPSRERVKEGRMIGPTDPIHQA